MNLLDREDLLSFLPGCIRTERTSTGLRLHRLTAQQVDYFQTANEAWGIRANCPAGITLHLETDSPTLDLTGRILPGARTYAGIDVEVDGRGLRSLRIDAGPETRTWHLLEGALTAGATRQRRKICVTLPQSAILELDAMSLDSDAELWMPAPHTLKYLAIGDSITQGMDARGPSSIYPVQLARMLNAHLLNLGVGGHIYDLAALDDELPFAPDLVTIAYGTNDWSRDLSQDQIANTVDEYLRRLMATVARSAKVYVLAPLWRHNGHEARAGGTLVEFSQAIATAAAGVEGVSVVDGTTLVPHRAELFADGTHPTDEGFLHYAINLKQAVERSEPTSS
ncbi:MAG: SGNH/GDSL hydrolase family protein [Gemmatimonadetes bacterium]|jgi:lysophospholipase L1-like esterase|nr:SGNH/GDSL hydrolase family protein [Gemmatimonadota bacterium]MBT6146391.1 SGNH/GDSL hydrolase family protein [Gemmatimonadota bacterium]MBT7858745.1 SGNH/GDSL hydrolase family protein [Gemmatimonadota bacterium]